VTSAPWVRVTLRWLKASWRVGTNFWDTFERAGGLHHAGSIAFFGILSLLPFSLLAIGLIARLLSAAPELLHTESAADAVLAPLRRAIPFLDNRLGELLDTLAHKPAPLSTFSLITLLYAASAGFNAASDGINAMLQTERRRHFLLTKLIIAGMVIVSVGGLVLWYAVAHFIAALASHVDVPIPDWIPTGTVVQNVVEFAVIVVGHFVLVRIVATERQARLVRWIGAVVFGALFAVARQLLGLYLTEVASYDRYYGTAGAFFGLSLWLYVVAIILLATCTLIRLLDELADSGGLSSWRAFTRRVFQEPAAAPPASSDGPHPEQ
jgi:membrane protein